MNKSTYLKNPEDKFGFWEIRIRDPELFKEIRTPDWSSNAGTKMSKQWIIADSIYDNSIVPEEVPDEEIENIDFIRKDKISEVHVRQGKTYNGQWTTQSVIIPKIISINNIKIDIPENIAGQIACYISKRLDRYDKIEASQYCS